MFKKLGQQKLVVYEKSRGIKPTDTGKKVALHILLKLSCWRRPKRMGLSKDSPITFFSRSKTASA
jgi:hypothetical protein